jgi:RNA polymerase sigma-70 factor (ECF subfamily)
MGEARPDSHQTCALLDRVRTGDRTALDELLLRHRPGLVAFVAARLDPRVRPRLDPSDVVQEAQLEVARRMSDFLEREPMPFHLWVRKAAYERMLKLRRRHVETRRRSVGREHRLPNDSSLTLARVLLSTGSPSSEAQAREFAERVTAAVANLAEADREVLLMRQVERLSYDEVACLLEVTPAAARQRYGRALLRLRQVLKEGGLLEGGAP